MDAITGHVELLVSACERIPREQWRGFIIAFCQALFAKGVPSADVFAIEYQAMEQLAELSPAGS